MRTTTITMIRRGALALVMCAVAFTFSQTGRTQSACVVERGKDPLDVLNSGVRHNVWFILDTSGSMGGGVGGGVAGTKMDVSKRVIRDLLAEFVDAGGRPLVNWGFAWYWLGQNGGGTGLNNQCIDPQNGYGVYPDAGVPNDCEGLDPQWFDPPACEAADPRQTINDQLDIIYTTAWTPNGIVTLQMGRAIGQNFIANLLPNQKNYIILLTDGEDTCECDDTIWPNTTPGSVNLRGNSSSPFITTNHTGNNDIKAFNAGYKGREAFRLMNGGIFPATEAGVIGDVFVVGLGLNANGRRRTNHLAWESSNLRRAALFADNEAQLKQALKDALSQIGIPASEVSATEAVNATVKEVIPSITNPAVSSQELLADVTTPDYDDIRESRQHRDGHLRNVTFTTSFEVPGFRGKLSAHSAYTVTDANSPKTARQFDFSKMWEAGELLQQRDPDQRLIYFNRPGSTQLVEFNVQNCSTSTGGTGPCPTAAELGVGTGFLDRLDGVGALTSADAAEIVIRMVRGERITVHPTTNTIYTPAPNPQLNFTKLDEFGANIWKLYDITGAPAIVQSPGRAPDFDPPLNHGIEYGVGQLGTPNQGFYWDNINRGTVVYVGTNQGLLHAFRAETGAELFAYIPDDILGLDTSNDVRGSRTTLKDVVELVAINSNGVANHLFALAGNVSGDDVFLQTTQEWHTVLGFGRGKGGRYVTALDITSVGGDWGGSTHNYPILFDTGEIADVLGGEAPKLLWNIGNPEEISDGFDQLDGLGETWGTPLMYNVPSSNPSQGDQWVMVVPGGYGCDNGSDEGQFLFVLDMETGSVMARYQIDDDTNAPIRNGLVSRVSGMTPHEEDKQDGKDWYTRFYAGDLHGSVWKLDVSDPNNWVWTKFVTLPGLNQPIAAGMALRYDPGTTSTYLFFGTGGDQRVSTVNHLFKAVSVLDNQADGSTAAGVIFWESDLLPEHRIDSDPALLGSIDGHSLQVFYVSNRVEFFPAECRERFFGALLAFAGATGGPIPNFDMDETQSGTQTTRDLGEGKATGVSASDQALYVTTGAGLGSTSETLVFTDDSGSGPQDLSPGATGGNVGGAIQVLVDSFRISPF